MKNTLKFFTSFAVLLLLSGCELTIPTNTTEMSQTKLPEVATFEDCMNAGYDVTDTNPKQCMGENRLFVEGEGEIVPNMQTPPPKKVTNFKECVAVGNNVMESYPRKCRHGSQTFTEKLDESSNNEQMICTRDYEPVCGELEVRCIKAPCLPVKTTFQNHCEAKKAGAKNIAEGECRDEKPNPEGACLSFDGTWLEAYAECEGMSEAMCNDLGGTFNECASACRHDPNAELCILSCVQVCAF